MKDLDKRISDAFIASISPTLKRYCELASPEQQTELPTVDTSLLKNFFRAGWEAHEEEELQDPEQWDWDKAERKSPIGPYPRVACYNKAIHEGHWYGPRNFQQSWCDGVREEKPSVKEHFRSAYCPWPLSENCASPIQTCPQKGIHTQHDWYSRELRLTVHHCPGIEKKQRPPEAQCPRVSRKEPHKAHSWVALVEIWWCSGIARRHYIE